MAVSTESVVHYTNEDNFKNILIEKGFKGSYCREHIRNASGGYQPFYVPVISFCDLPISQSLDSLNYGSYGIGLSKDWATKNGLNPILYLEKNSKLFNGLDDDFKKKGNDRSWAFKMLPYFKNYRNDLTRRDGSVLKNYIFYNEREWRYHLDLDVLESIPEFKEKKGQKLYVKDEVDKSIMNEAIASFRLKFEFSDIKYVLFESRSKLASIYKLLSKKMSYDDFEDLKTKSITKEQIDDM